MTRIPRAPLIGLVLLGMAVALAVLGLAQGGAKPAAAQPLTPHYECYNIPGTAPIPPVAVMLETKFGVEPMVHVGQATELCLPAAKNVPPIPNVPHLKCYNIEGEKAGRMVTLQTQFGTQQGVVLGNAKLLCVPALKTVVSPPEPPPSGPLATVPHYKCYEILSGGNDPGTVMLQTQFGTESGVNVGPSRFLCLSAIKTKLPGGTPEGTLTEPDLECYTLAQPPLDPPRVVELLSQFGLELALPVGPANLLCTPATTQVTGGVGGIAELPDMVGGAGDQAAAPDNGSGWSSAGYAALAGGLAAAAVLLSAGVWYARRRLLR